MPVVGSFMIIHVKSCSEILWGFAIAVEKIDTEQSMLTQKNWDNNVGLLFGMKSEWLYNNLIIIFIYVIQAVMPMVLYD